MRKAATILSILSAVTALISACFGLFYSFGGEQRTVQNIYGQTVTLYGDGIYANDSIMKVGATKGTDIAVIITAILLILTILVFKSSKLTHFLQPGLLSIILYASTCLAMEVSFNRLFLLYLIQFGCSLFAFILSFSALIKADAFTESLAEKRHTGTGIFMILAGCSVLVWMMFIIPAIVTGEPMEIIDIYTTTPTFVIDLAIILPTAIFSGIMILRQKDFGYKTASVLMILLSGVGLCVIMQTIMQTGLGIVLPIGQIIGLVVSFVLLGGIAIVLNIRLLKYAK